MIRADMIHDEAVKAALLTDERLGMREILAAAINAWPGVDRYLGAVVLPLPQGAAAPLEPRDE